MSYIWQSVVNACLFADIYSRTGAENRKGTGSQVHSGS